MVEHVYRRAAEAQGVDAVVVATDDERIAHAVETFGGVVRMTQPGHRTGTDRVAETARHLRCEIVVNVQTDLPLVEPDMISEVIAPLADVTDVQMSTLRRVISDPADHDNPNVVKVVVDRNGDALYFSRSKIPYCREDGVCFKHIGLYGFRREFLLMFAALQQTPLERAESLEQLRALEHGYRIRAVETRFESVEVDTPDDLERVRRRMSAAARV
jgi:3-deoxy-manno-octulosonate cytidylyltransferase (CMP-KDO synthetase)